MTELRLREARGDLQLLGPGFEPGDEINSGKLILHFG